MEDPLLDNHGRAAGADHQHAAVGADRFIIEIDADDGIRAQMPGLFAHFTKSNVLGLAQLSFIGCRSAAHDITNRREEIPKDVRAEDGIAGNQPQILDRLLSVDTRCRR